jgi:hypothetical protein
MGDRAGAKTINVPLSEMFVMLRQERFHPGATSTMEFSHYGNSFISEAVKKRKRLIFKKMNQN